MDVMFGYGDGPIDDDDKVDNYNDDKYNNCLTYLEEKGIFWRNIHYAAHRIIPKHNRHTPQRPQQVNIRPIPPPRIQFLRPI